MHDANAHKPGYKHTPLGWVPKEWEVKELQEVTQKTIVYGIVQAGPEIHDGVPYIKSTDVGREININGLSRTSLEIAQKYKRSEVNPGDIVFSLRGNIGAVSIVPSSLRRANLTQGTARISIKEAYDNKFIKLALNSPFVIRDIIVRAKGSTFMEISLEELRKVPVPLPPLPEQNKIATILSTWDSAIAKTQEIIRQLQERNRGLMQELLTGKRRLKGFESKWEKRKLGNLLVKHDEKTIYSNQYPILTSSREGLFLQKDYYKREVASMNNAGYNVVPRGFFTYRHMSDDLIFKFNINEIVDKGIVSTLYPVFTTTSELDSYFLKYKLNEGHEFISFAQEQKQGGSRTYMYFSKLTELSLMLPNLTEQIAIRSAIDKANEELNLYAQKLLILQTQKKGLMQKLLTGAIRVSPSSSSNKP